MDLQKKMEAIMSNSRKLRKLINELKTDYDEEDCTKFLGTSNAS